MTGISVHTSKNLSLAPLGVFRIIFGLLMIFSSLRFWSKGWIYDLYIAPDFHFKYFGFEWVQPLEGIGMYFVFAAMIIAALGICLGLSYRISAILFFVCFTYVELLDVSNYLNHYYFVSLISFLLIFLPANKISSLDIRWRGIKPMIKGSHWFVNILRIMLSIVYIYAGIAKLNPDWMLEALPLKIWLPSKANLPIIGSLMDYRWVAYFFSWFGAFYDLSIPFFLWNKRTRPFAFIAVVLFHVLTWILFPIGVFPWVMIFCTLIFFSDGFHKRILELLRPIFGSSNSISSLRIKPALKYFFYFFISFQLLLPWRFLAYPGELFWTEQGYRFSWRVMLMEKAGYVTYRIVDPKTGNQGEIQPADYLTPNQEKQLGTQPDLILQFAHFLQKEYQKQGIENPEIYADCFVNLQTRGSKRFIDPNVDLTKIEDSFAHKFWILPNE